MKLRTILFSSLLVFTPLTVYATELTQEEFDKQVDMRYGVISSLQNRVNEEKAKSNRTEAIQLFCFYHTAVDGLRDSAIDNIDLEGAVDALKAAKILIQRRDEIYEDAGTTYYDSCKGPNSIWSE